jgi:Outer membrane efflux protein
VKRRGTALAALVTVLLAGCMVGPEYMKPSVPMTPTFKEGGGWKVAQPADRLPRGAWWQLYGDPELSALADQVAAANQDLKIAEARYRQARAAILFNRASLFPTISAGAGASTSRLSDNRPFLPPGVSLGNSGDFLVCLLDRVEQLLIPEGLGQKFHRARLHGLHRHGNVPMTGDEDDGDRDAGLGQLTLEIEAAQSRQSHIQNEASRRVRTLAAQEFLGGRERLHAETDRSDETPERVANRPVVIDDEHHGLVGPSHSAVLQAGRAN